MKNRNKRMFNDNAMKFGIFAPNCSSGIIATTVEERWEMTWENNLRLAKIADQAGIECIIPVARWRGYGGETNFENVTFETITWATGLLAHTKNINIFGTVHAPFVHPILAAKQIVTADHIGEGRMGLNIVCGWNFDEFAMFGKQPLDHDDRYAYGQEWWDVVKRIWSEEGSFDFEGKHIKLYDVVGEPKPFAGEIPIVMNAGASDIGREFGASNFDCLFTTIRDIEKTATEIADNRKLAKKHGNDVMIFTNSLIICRSTRKEAEEYYDYTCRQHRDTEAVEKLLQIRGIEAEKMPPGFMEMMRDRLVGHGLYPLIGDPDDIANKLLELSEVGFNGSSLAWVDYISELEFFAAEVIPRLEKLGLRQPLND